jgi:hypothetical protein
MYRCQVCRKRTEDIDNPPCSGHEFVPQQIKTIHKFIYDRSSRTVTVLCTGKPPRPGTTGLGGNYGINCIRCRTKMDPSSSRESDEGAIELAEPTNPDKLPTQD